MTPRLTWVSMLQCGMTDDHTGDEGIGVGRCVHQLGAYSALRYRRDAGNHWPSDVVKWGMATIVSPDIGGSDMKANSIIGTEVLTYPGGEAHSIRFVVKGAGEVTLDLERISPANKSRAMVHGFIQRVSDGAALSRDAKTGLPATAADKLAAMSRLVDHYASGTEQWSLVAAGGVQGGLLFEALCEANPDQSAEDIRAWLDARSDKEQAALREDDSIAPIIARIKAERAKDKPKMDTKGLLASLKAAKPE